MKIDVFGVKMTSLEEMRFSRHLENNKITMNTIYKEQRTKIAKDWLNSMHALQQTTKII